MIINSDGINISWFNGIYVVFISIRNMSVQAIDALFFEIQQIIEKKTKKAILI